MPPIASGSAGRCWRRSNRPGPEDRGQRTEGGASVNPRLRLPFLRLAIAAAILVAATAAVWMWFGPAGRRTAFDRVRLATESAPWMRAVATRYTNGDVRTEQHWYNFAAKEAYTVTEDGAVVGYDYGPEQVKLAYSPRLKAVVVSELPRAGLFGAESAYSFVEAFAVFAARDDVAVEESTAEYEGRTVRAYDIQVDESGSSARTARPSRGFG